MSSQQGAVGSGTGQAAKEHRRMNEVIGVVAFGLFAGLWLAFGYAIVASQGSLDEVWRWIREMPLIGQVVLVLLTLPVTVGLWVWETSWPLIVRLVLVVGLGTANLVVFFPRFLLDR
jgi:hypothetical protein